MKDVTLALREMADRADERLLPDPQTLREQVAPASRRRRRVRAGAWVAAAASVAVVIGLGVPALDGEQPAPAEQPRPGGESPAPSPTFDFETEPYGEEQGWEEVPFGKGVGWNAVAFGNGTYVAVADTSTAERVGDTATAAGRVPMWWSTDGRAWTRVEDGAGPATMNVWSVIATDAGFVALAVAPRGGTVPYLSEDGRTWRPSDTVPSGFRPYAVVETDLGLVAWGRGSVWVSGDDARSWKAESESSTWPRVSYTLNPCWVEQTGEGLQALVISKGGGPDGTAVRWRSADGLTWQRVENVPTSNPLALCGKHDEDAHRTTGTSGTVAIAPNDGTYNSSIFFRPSEREQ
jgi:hypothetical protein